jgi:hypothetical protein
MSRSTEASVGIPPVWKKAKTSRNWPSIKAEIEMEFGKRGKSGEEDERVRQFVNDASRHPQDIFATLQKDVRGFALRNMMRMMSFIVSSVFLPTR